MGDATIFALSSGRPPSAIAVVRISGERAVQALAALSAAPPPPRRMVLRKLTDPRDGALIDEALVAFFPSTSSVSGEDLVELHLHGGKATIAAAESALASIAGLRKAEPGEFTSQAFRNGKLDLVQVEGLADLLRAETEGQRRAALFGSGGGLSQKIEEWQSALLGIAADVEAAIDHSDEDDVATRHPTSSRDAAEGLLAQLREVLSRPTTRRLFDGIRVAVAGPPNAGKSSLINAIAQREAAIVSPIAGTTRDLIEVPLQIGGVPYIFIDTAGLRDAPDDPIEAIGIERAESAVANADIIIWLGNEAPTESQALWLYPQCDRVERPAVNRRLAVSSVTGEGLSELLRIVGDRATSLLPTVGDTTLSDRQHRLLNEISRDIANFVTQDDELIAAEHLRTARQSFDALTGRADTEAMLDHLFARFCVGK